MSVQASPQRAQIPPNVITAKDVVLSGCGRVYVFPREVPPQERDAGLNYLQHRVGYVEPSQAKWVPRDLGNFELSSPTTGRSAALRIVLAHAGYKVLGPLFDQGLASMGMQAQLASSPGADSAHVYVSGDGRVFVSPEGDEVAAGKGARWIGFLWRSGRRFAVLGTDEQSSMTTHHRDGTEALTRLVSSSGYINVVSTT